MAANEVSLFDAKTHLSRLVARAERGEVVTITRRGRAVARLVPARDTDRPGDRRTLLGRLRSFRGRIARPVDVRALVREGRRD
jgi:prevent-host-death family protein